MGKDRKDREKEEKKHKRKQKHHRKNSSPSRSRSSSREQKKNKKKSYKEKTNNFGKDKSMSRSKSKSQIKNNNNTKEQLIINNGQKLNNQQANNNTDQNNNSNQNNNEIMQQQQQQQLAQKSQQIQNGLENTAATTTNIQSLPMINQINPFNQQGMMISCPQPPNQFMENKIPNLAMPFQFFPPNFMSQFYMNMMPIENPENKITKKQSPSDIGILLDKGLVSKKTVQQNAMFQNTDHFVNLASVVLQMQVSIRNLPIYLSVLKRVILQLDNTFSDLKIREQKRQISRFISLLQDKDNFKKKNQNINNNIDDIDLMHLIYETKSNLLQTIHLYNSQNHHLIDKLKNIQQSNDYSYFDTTYQEAMAAFKQLS